MTLPGGPEGARARLVAYLADSLPNALAAVAGGLEVAAASLPMPRVMPPQETQLLSVNDFPALIVTISDTTRTERQDWDPDTEADLLWRVTYISRVFAFARGTTPALTTDARDRYGLALRWALLGRPSLGTIDAQVDETTWRESYSDTTMAGPKTRRTIAACYAEFQVTMLEAIPPVISGPTGTVDTTEVIGVTVSGDVEL